MSPTVTTFLFEAANFLVLAAALGWLFFKPVRQAIIDYREKFEADNQQAAAKLAEAEAMRQQVQVAHADLQAELNERRDVEVAAIQRQADDILSETRAAAVQQRKQSLLQASQISDSQRDTLAEVAAASAAEAVGKLLQQIEGPELQGALIQAACRQLEPLKQSAISPVKVESSGPLSAEQTAAVQTIYSIGRRCRGALAKQSLLAARSYDAPASLEGLSQLLLGLAQDVLEDYMSQRIGSLQVVSAGFGGVGHFDPVSIQVLPIQSVAATSPLQPSPFVKADHLTAVAVREFIYITLYEILLDALAAEHGMRLMAAESALEWLDSTAVMTSRRLTSARSEAATQELLDIVAGGRKRFQEDL